MNKKLLITIIVLSVMLISIFGALSYLQNNMEELPKKAESFYIDNKEQLNEFVKFCFKKGLDDISKHNLDRKSINSLYEIGGYFVYAKNDIDEDDKVVLSETIELCKKNGIGEIYIDEMNQDYISFTMSFFLAGCGIEYRPTHKSTDEIKKENYSENAWYVDDNWVIIDYD